MKSLLVVGGGITGLLTALRLHKDYKVTIIDAGADPRVNNHTFGATYSGLDARHISFTETAPWTSEYHNELIMKDSAKGGWLCIPRKDLNDFEKQWITQFQNTANNSKAHKINTKAVINLNIQGISEWEKLGKTYDFLKPINDESVMPIICRSKEDLLDEFNFESSLDKRVKLYDGTQLPHSLLPLSPNLKALGNLGYFTLFGRSYRIKTICNDLINFLESRDVSFRWNQYFSKIDADIIVWCSGVSAQTSKLLRNFDILLGGVIGCWVLMDNPGIIKACKIYGPEPVNYINITPVGSTLLMSGGYGFVGTREYTEAISLAQPIMNQMIKEIKNWFPESEIKEKAFCIRPATPSGVPILLKDTLNGIPVVIAVGHCAGGFTQAPYTAKRVEKEINNVL